MSATKTRRTFVCRPDIDRQGKASCTGGGFWMDDDGSVPTHHCGKRMTELAPTFVVSL